MSKYPQKLYFVFVLLVFNASLAQKNNDFSYKIDSLIKNTSPRIFNGVILISQHGVPVYFKAFGYSNFSTKTPFKPNDELEIMSNSKQITAVLILKEFEKGKLKLYEPIKNYLPFLSQSWADTVTIHQLLTHTHGIIELEKPTVFKPGSSFRYGNLSYDLLGKIIEYSAKKSYRLMAAELFKSLKMNNTHCFKKELNDNLVSGHINKNNEMLVLNPDSTQILETSLPADGIVSTAKDLSIWSTKLHNGKILKASSYKLMTESTVMAQHNVFGSNKVAYAYGIRINHEQKPHYLGHTGLGDGFAAVNLYFPDADVSLVVLENQTNAVFDLNYYYGTEIKKILMRSSLLSNK